MSHPGTKLTLQQRERLRVIGIESSCDETGVAVYDSEKGLMADLLYSQIDLHKEYGGVVPELASRDHIRKTLPMIDQALSESGSTKNEIDGIAYTAGPGLVGALLVGASIAKSLAFAWNVPAIGVHHMEGHLLASMLSDTPPKYPFYRPASIWGSYAAACLSWTGTVRVIRRITGRCSRRGF